MLRRLLALPLLLSPCAHSADLLVFGGLNLAAPTEIRAGVDQHWTGAPASLFGLGIELPLSGIPLGLETGALLKNSKSEQTSNGSTTTLTGTWTEIPVIIHYHFDPSISLGLGGYWSFLSKGDAVSPLESPDSGVLLDLRARIRISDAVALFLDARYQHGLTNLAATPTDTLNTRSVQILGGIAFWPFSGDEKSEPKP